MLNSGDPVDISVWKAKGEILHGTPAKSCVKNFRDREKTRILAFTERCKYERDPVYYFGTVYSAAGV